MYHSHEFDADLCQELQPVTRETRCPRWFPLLMLGVIGFYGAVSVAALSVLA